MEHMLKPSEGYSWWVTIILDMSRYGIKIVERTTKAYFIRAGDRDPSGCFDFFKS